MLPLPVYFFAFTFITLWFIMPVSNAMFSMSVLNQNNVFLVPVEEAIGPTF
jgi:peptidoglycan biosynthesis protein MviN/MurJ (putative lipid II flippase)